MITILIFKLICNEKKYLFIGAFNVMISILKYVYQYMTLKAKHMTDEAELYIKLSNYFNSEANR